MCKQCIIKEIIIYFIILIVLAVLMHPDLLSNPSERLTAISELGKESHPFIYSFIFYLIVFGVRKIVRKVLSKIVKKEQ
jgi:hypothetical membrane protein